jgi:primosomal replication protein N
VESNRVVLSGIFARSDALRYTPAGVPVLDFLLRHVSSQIEAGRSRRVELEVAVVAIGDLATRLARKSAGGRVEIAGFLAQRSVRSAQLVVHATEVRD